MRKMHHVRLGFLPWDNGGLFLILQNPSRGLAVRPSLSGPGCITHQSNFVTPCLVIPEDTWA